MPKPSPENEKRETGAASGRYPSVRVLPVCSKVLGGRRRDKCQLHFALREEGFSHALGHFDCTRCSSPADAQTRKRAARIFESYQDWKAKRAYAARYAGGPRARFTVRRERSFLDPGTEVESTSRSYTDYVIPPDQRLDWAQCRVRPPTPAGWQNPNWPLPGRFEYGTSRTAGW